MVGKNIHEEITPTENLDSRLTGTLNISIEDLMDEVFNRSHDTDIPPNAFTTQQFMSRHNLGRTAALRILHQQAERGFLCTHIAPYNGRSRVRIWWKNAD